MPRVVHTLLLLSLSACNGGKAELQALCAVPGVSPRQHTEALGQYLDRTGTAAAPALFKSLAQLPLAERASSLRLRAFKAGLVECPLADLWEMDEQVHETRPRPTEGVQLRYGGAADLKARIAASRALRQVLDDAGYSTVRVNAVVDASVELIAIEVPKDVRRGEVEKTLAPALPKLGLTARPAVNIHGNTLDP